MKDYSLDKSPKYYAKHGTWFERLPRDHDGDDLAYARHAVERVPDWKCPDCMNRCGDHTAEELAACLRIERDKIGLESVASCLSGS